MRNYKELFVKNHPTIQTKEEWIKAKQQQSNFETIIQIVSLRSQPTIITKPTLKKESGKLFNKKGTLNTWTFVFSIEHDDVYSDFTDKLALLKQDCTNVPLITNLDEQITDEYLVVQKNIIFEIQQNDIQ